MGKFGEWGGKPLLVRWTTNYDCEFETDWWYVVKDSAFDISDLKAKRRYEIKKGLNNFNVRVIRPEEYTQVIFQIHKAALCGYPEKYRPTMNENEFIENIKINWIDKLVYGAFDLETGKLCGYALLTVHDDWAEFNVLKTIPELERRAINAAIIYKIMVDFNNKLSEGYYICDGEKSISHETAFQDYLEKYFDFRKAYCELNIKYRFSVRCAVNVLYPFRNVLKKYDVNLWMHNVLAVLKMEEIVRNKK